MRLLRLQDLKELCENASSGTRVIFRGQTRDYGALIPAFYRMQLTLDLNHLASLASEIFIEAMAARPMADWARQLDEKLFSYDDSEDEDTPFNFPFGWGGPTHTQVDGYGYILESHGPSSHLSLALLQHYGVPTGALDITFDPAVASWFATHQFISTGSRRGYYQLCDPGVIYVMQAPSDKIQDLREVFNVPVAGLRGHRQQGGLLFGATAETPDLHLHILEKISLSEYALDYRDLANLNQKYLFPSPEEDSFYRRLLNTSERHEHLLDLLKWIMEYETPPLTLERRKIPN